MQSIKKVLGRRENDRELLIEKVQLAREREIKRAKKTLKNRAKDGKKERLFKVKGERGAT